MPYIILEMQTDAEGNVAIPTPINAREDYNEAQSVFFYLASIAAVSSVPQHTVMLIENNGVCWDFKTFKHGEPVPEVVEG